MRRLGRLVIIAMPAYFTWEMLQAPLFTGMPEDWRLATVFCALATIGDVVLLFALLALGRLLFGDARWFAPPQVSRYATIVAFGLVGQAAIEWLAVERLHLWGYEPWHPRLPIIGAGIVPFLQPIVIVPLVLWLAARWAAET